MKKNISQKLKLFMLSMVILPLLFSMVACGGIDENMNNEEDNDNKTQAINVTTAEELSTALSSDEDNITICLDNDIVLTETQVISKTVTINLNEKTISNTDDLWNTSNGKNNWSFFSVREGGNLTIDGNGTLKTKENDCYAIDLQDENALCEIKSGNIIGNISAVYVYYGNLKISGGEFSIQQLNSNNIQDSYGLTINCYDSSYTAGTASVTISGGSFHNFNPAENGAESGTAKTTNFLADGYGVTSSEVTSDSGSYILYTVSANQ